MISTIFFDLDDTLLWDKQSIKKSFENTCLTVSQCNPQQLEDAVRAEADQLYKSYPTYPFTQMIGINPFEGLWGTFNDPGKSFQALHSIIKDYQHQAWHNGLKTCGVDDSKLAEELAKRFITERKKRPFVYQDTFYVLDALKSNYQLLLLTNGAPSLQRMKLAITPEIAKRFDHIIISGEFGKGKPDPAIFEHALEKAHVSPSQAMMIGDNLMTDILGANRSGIKNIWINHHNQQITAVKPTYEVKSLIEILPIILNK
ncbi:putative hydrolase of the HAD superfamily [Amphibacillus marinus]|uniref:Phosphoserine phosphatase n=1 Tax=Amphibacillus marinus TaxID=872970 RepID=A0A1H8PIX1_9BACI|nr:HAD family hydrolase [Amphibacillus marinus]SEO41865.1 putative hydrolase of the HAD superfamily [Amphibacillus marinus]